EQPPYRRLAYSMRASRVGQPARRLRLRRPRLQLRGELRPDQRRLIPRSVERQPGQMIGRGTPATQRREQPIDRLLEYRRAIADLRRLADRCVDHWVESDDPAEKFPARRWGVGGFAPGHRECIAEATGDAGRQIREQ